MTFSAKIDKESPKCTEEGEGVTSLGLSNKIYHCFTPAINEISRNNFKDMSQLIWLEGKHTVQRAHCALSSCVLLVFSRVTMQIIHFHTDKKLNNI